VTTAIRLAAALRRHAHERECCPVGTVAYDTAAAEAARLYDRADRLDPIGGKS